MDLEADHPPLVHYGVSKAGNYLHGVVFARRYKADGVLSVPLNPGNLRLDLYRDWKIPMRWILNTLTYPPLHCAYTELYAGG
jgi:hypothetical protein